MEENLTSDAQTVQKQPSVFTGGMLANFGINLATVLATLCTLGIAYPFLVCWRERWIAKHTYINGYKLCFDGNGMQLFGKYIIWLLLSVVTLGIYYILCVAVRLEAWRTKHTHFDGIVCNDDENDSNNKSKFDGTWLQLLGVKWLTNFVTVITLSFGMYWAHCYKQRWFAKHKEIDGCRFYFTGTGLQYFGKCIVWFLLTIVTFGIYSLWLTIKSKKWTVSHTEAESLPEQFTETDSENTFTPVDTAAIQKAETDKPKKTVHAFSVAGLTLGILVWAMVILVLKSTHMDFIVYFRYMLFADRKYTELATILVAGCVFSVLGLTRVRKNKENIVVPIVGMILNILPLLNLLFVNMYYYY